MKKASLKVPFDSKGNMWDYPLDEYTGKETKRSSQCTPCLLCSLAKKLGLGLCGEHYAEATGGFYR